MPCLLAETIPTEQCVHRIVPGRLPPTGWTPVTVAITKAFSVAVRSKDVHVVVHATEALTGISQEAPASGAPGACWGPCAATRLVTA